jgi:hypothetical protein
MGNVHEDAAFTSPDAIQAARACQPWAGLDHQGTKRHTEQHQQHCCLPDEREPVLKQDRPEHQRKFATRDQVEHRQQQRGLWGGVL